MSEVADILQTWRIIRDSRRIIAKAEAARGKDTTHMLFEQRRQEIRRLLSAAKELLNDRHPEDSRQDRDDALQASLSVSRALVLLARG